MTVLDPDLPTPVEGPFRAPERVHPAVAPRSRATGSWLLRRKYSVLGLALTIALVGTGLLPPQLGGSTTYVITRGVSMLPQFHAGDLVVVRREPSYRVGQVAAYHNGELGVVVLHRIYAVNGDHYAFKGDNNNFVDSYQPTTSQIVGAEWLHLPGAGRWVNQLREPLVAAVLLGLLWLYTFGPRSKSRRQRRRHRHVR